MITHDPYGISNAVKPGKLPEQPYHAETINTCDTPENINRCLNCTRENCGGECGKYAAQKKIHEKRRNNINRLAEIKYSGGTDRYAMECLGLTKEKIRQYEKTVQYGKKMESLRRKRRANTGANEQGCGGACGGQI